jgi:hypothetical protein
LKEVCAGLEEVLAGLTKGLCWFDKRFVLVSQEAVLENASFKPAQIPDIHLRAVN